MLSYQSLWANIFRAVTNILSVLCVLMWYMWILYHNNKFSNRDSLKEFRLIFLKLNGTSLWSPMIPEGRKYLSAQFQPWPWATDGNGCTFQSAVWDRRAREGGCRLGDLRLLRQRTWPCLLDHLWAIHTGPSVKPACGLSQMLSKRRAWRNKVISAE